MNNLDNHCRPDYWPDTPQNKHMKTKDKKLPLKAQPTVSSPMLVWNPKPDITLQELAVALPYVMGRFPLSVEVVGKIPALKRHFDLRHA